MRRAETLPSILCFSNMSFVSDVLQRLFPPDLPYFSMDEPIALTPALAQRLQQWDENPHARKCLHALRGAWELKKQGKIMTFPLFVHQSNGAEGLYFPFQHPLTEEDAVPLQEHLAAKLGDLGYYRTHGNLQTKEVNGVVQTRRFLYYKRKPSLDESPWPQAYGNLHLECFALDQKPQWLKIMAFTYSDRQYQPPLPFQELMDHLFASR
jgi:hypothetical protein